MGRQNSSGGGGPSKAPMRKQQQEAAKARRQSARKARRKGAEPIKSFDMTPYTLHLRCNTEGWEACQAAFEAVRKSETLRIYVPRYRYPEHWQRAVMEGSITIELPFSLAQRVERELAPHWKKGSAPDEA